MRYLADTSRRHLVSAPDIYSMILPLLFLDLCVFVYQWVCIPLYRIARVKRRDDFAFDREQLAYLNLVEKLNCGYCAYSNGLLAYVQEIVARTEQYWCPIKHARRVLNSHAHYPAFVDFCDAQAYRQELKSLRRQLQREKPPEAGPSRN